MVVDDDQIGVIVKSWVHYNYGYSHSVYVRSYNSFRTYIEPKIQHFVFSKTVSGDDYELYKPLGE